MDTTPELLLLTVAEASKQLRVSERNMYYILQRGELPRVRIGDRTLIRTKDLREYIDARVMQAA